MYRSEIQCSALSYKLSVSFHLMYHRIAKSHPLLVYLNWLFSIQIGPRVFHFFYHVSELVQTFFNDEEGQIIKKKKNSRRSHMQVLIKTKQYLHVFMQMYVSPPECFQLS